MDTIFRSSSFCAGGACVEVGWLPDGQVALRDGKDPDLPAHHFTREEWVVFVDGVKNGEFDLT